VGAVFHIHYTKILNREIEVNAHIAEGHISMQKWANLLKRKGTIR
jgi:hypothetical protein